MVVFILVIVTVITGLFCYCLSVKTPRKPKLPPGPLCLPFLGSIFAVDANETAESYRKLAKQYGPIFKVAFGSDLAVVLNDPALIKEAYSQEVFVPRPIYWDVEQRSIANHGTNGIVFAKGELWKEHRRFILQTFRDFGVGKEGMEEKIVDEAAELVKIFEQCNEQSFDNKIPISTAIANVISNVVTGRRYEATDPVFLKFIENVKEMFVITLPAFIINTFPWTRFLPPMNKTHKQFRSTQNGIQVFLENICDEHLKNWVPGQNFDLLDHYISAVKSGSHKSFSYKELPLILDDLFEAGFETTTTTLRWAFLMMCIYPDVQKKVQAELDATVPAGVIPKPSDKFNLPYVDATVLEIHRYGSVVTLGVDHCAAEDTILASYLIPKGTWIQSNLRYVHHNEEWWDKPEEFNPERFLMANGEVKEFSEYLMPFSVGKRRCLGEALAKAEVYIFFTAIMQNFQLHLDGDTKTFDLRPVPGITSDTKPHKIICVPRTKTL